MKSAYMLWRELGDVPTDENDRIELDYLHFPVGTDKYEIWHWFEDTFDCSITEFSYQKSIK